MIPTRNLRITYPSSQKIYVPGEINRLKVGMRLITLSDSLVPDENGKKEKKSALLWKSFSGFWRAFA